MVLVGLVVHIRPIQFERLHSHQLLSHLGRLLLGHVQKPEPHTAFRYFRLSTIVEDAGK